MDDGERSAQMAKAIRVVAVEHQAGRDDDCGCAAPKLVSWQLENPPERRFTCVQSPSPQRAGQPQRSLIEAWCRSRPRVSSDTGTRRQGPKKRSERDTLLP